MVSVKFFYNHQIIYNNIIKAIWFLFLLLQSHIKHKIRFGDGINI